MAKLYIITAQDVEDNLVSDLQDVPLSANMGRVLNTNKVEKNQGTQYAGKVLGIGDDGMVVPVEGGGGGGVALITASAGEGGTITPIGEIGVLKGEDKTFTISPNSGYVIVDVKVDNVSVGAVSTYTFTHVQENHTINATFKVPQRYSMTIPSGSGNSVSKNIIYGDSAAGMSESQRDELIKEHTRFAVVKWDGSKPTINYWLYRNNLNQKATDETCNTSAGTSSNLTGTDGDVMVLYDQVWWKWSKSGDNHIVTFTWDNPGDSSWVSPHHYGDTLDSTTYATYVGMGVFPAYNSSNQMRSINTSSEPTGNVSQNNFYVAATYGRNWQYNNKLPMTYAWYITCLYFVKRDRNCQAAYGNGIVSGSAGATNKDWSATNAWNNGTTTSDTTGVTALGVHNPWGQKLEFLGECRNDGGTIKFSALCGKDHYNIESGTASTWVSATGTSTSISGYTPTEILGSSCPQFPFFATAASGSDYSIYYADAWYGSSSSGPCVFVGGSCSLGLRAGPLCVNARNAASLADAYLGARLHVTII